MKAKLSDKETLQRSKRFFEAALDGSVAYSKSVNNNIGQLKSMLELEQIHHQLMGKITEVLSAMLEVCDNLEQREQNLTIH